MDMFNLGGTHQEKCAEAGKPEPGLELRCCRVGFFLSALNLTFTRLCDWLSWGSFLLWVSWIVPSTQDQFYSKGKLELIGMGELLLRGCGYICSYILRFLRMRNYNWRIYFTLQITAGSGKCPRKPPTNSPSLSMTLERSGILYSKCLNCPPSHVKFKPFLKYCRINDLNKRSLLRLSKQ